MKRKYIISARLQSKARNGFILLLFISISIVPMEAQNNLVSFKAIEKFWPIYDKLKLDINPTDSDWENLFNSDGMQVLLKSEFDENYFKNYYRLAFMPSKHNAFLKELSKNNWKIQYLSHLFKINQEDNRIKEEVKRIKTNNNLIFKELERTKKFLPLTVETEHDLPQISFVFFGNDARGYSRIIIDFLYYINNKEAMNYLVAHEAHHFYRNKYLSLTNNFRNNAEETIVMTLNQLQAEGIADQIDKPFTYFNNGPLSKTQWANNFKAQFMRSNMIIKEMDSILTKIHRSPKEMDQYAEAFYNCIPMSGHPTGYFIANVIIEVLGKEPLIQCWTDPFEFILLYQLAAEKSLKKYPSFSNQSIELIKILQNKYKIE